MQIQCIASIASLKTQEIIKSPPTLWTSLHSTYSTKDIEYQLYNSCLFYSRYAFD